MNVSRLVYGLSLMGLFFSSSKSLFYRQKLKLMNFSMDSGPVSEVNPWKSRLDVVEASFNAQ